MSDEGTKGREAAANLGLQRQTVIGQFYQLDRLVVEGGLSVCYPYPRTKAQRR